MLTVIKVKKLEIYRKYAVRIWISERLCVHGGGLSGSVVSQQCGDVSLVEGQVEVVDGVPPAIGFGQAM